MPTTLTLKSIPDEVFVAVAINLGVKAITQDRKLLKSFPGHTAPLRSP